VAIHDKLKLREETTGGTTETRALVPPASLHGVAFRARRDAPPPAPPSENENSSVAARDKNENAAFVARLEAELAETRDALASARFEMDVLEAELVSTRERAAEATALAKEAARAAAVTEDLASARVELESKTAELARLRGVLKGKLLARVLAEADETRERVRELDALDALDGDFGAWESERRA
jgi:hypothetical protein